MVFKQLIVMKNIAAETILFKNISDDQIEKLVLEKNKLGYLYLYNKYSGMIYGTILRLTKNKELSDVILVKLFNSLKENPFEFKSPLFLPLLQFTYALTIKNLPAGAILEKSALCDASYPQA